MFLCPRVCVGAVSSGGYAAPGPTVAVRTRIVCQAAGFCSQQRSLAGLQDDCAWAAIAWALQVLRQSWPALVIERVIATVLLVLELSFWRP